MKNIKDIDGNIIKVDSGCTVQPFHAYISLTLSLLEEPFMSSDLKFLIIRGSFSYLKNMGYSDEEIEVYASKLREIVKENIVVNSFMG
jgi:hypothetical protein